MKLLIWTLGSGGSFFQLKGIANAFQSIGWEVHMWAHNQNAAPLDIFNQINPDLFIGSTYRECIGDRATQKAIRARPSMKVVLYGKTWGPINDRITKDLVIDVPNQEDFTNLRALDGFIDYIYIHHHNKVVKETLGWYERDFGLKTLGIGKGIDLVEYRKGAYDEGLASDVCFIGGSWPYKNKTLHPYILPLTRMGLNVKIWGGGWSTIYCLGNISERMASDAWASAKVCINVHELHSQRLGCDVIERPFKCLGSGNFVVSDYVESLVRDYLTEDDIVTARSPEEFHEKVRYFVANPEERLAYIKRGQARVLSDHTYHDRTAELLSLLGYKEEAALVAPLKEKLIREKFPVA
jgi:hypothetical protein